MTATERFFEMARKKAQRIVHATGKPFDNAISKKRPSLQGCVPTGIRVVKPLAHSARYGLRALPSGLPRGNSNAAVQNLCQQGLIWTVYILECADKTLYTGITNNMENRLAKHTNGTGAKYTRGRAPYTIIYTELHSTKGAALKREAEIKSLNRRQKWKLVATRPQ